MSIPVPILTEQQLQRFESWLQKVLWEATLSLPEKQGPQPAAAELSIHRVKGRIILTSGFIKMVQGVRDVFEVTELAQPTKREPCSFESRLRDRAGKLVLIGKGLLDLPWEASMMHSIQDP